MPAAGELNYYRHVRYKRHLLRLWLPCGYPGTNGIKTSFDSCHEYKV